MFCIECGEKLNESDNYCPKCGKKNNFENQKIINENDNTDIEVKDVSVIYIFVLLGIYCILSMIILKMVFFEALGFSLGAMILALPILAIIYIIQMISKVKYKRPILYMTIISIVVFLIGIMGNLSRG